MAIHLEEVKQGFAARVTGIDLKQTPSEDDVAAINAAILKFPVLVFPEAKITDQQQAAFASHFGPLQYATGYTQGPSDGRLDRVMTDSSNIGTDDKTFQRGDRRRMNLLGSRRWHTDGSYKKIPAKISFLQAHVVPEKGGETQFADMQGAYESFPPELKELIDGLVVEHSLIHSRKATGFENPLTDHPDVLPVIHQRLVRRHPDTGRRSVYVSSHASHIVDWPLPEGLDLLYELTDRATKPEFVYTHKWTVGDVVMWDNRVTMHRVLRHYPEDAPRDLRRTSVEDNAPTLEQVA